MPVEVLDGVIKYRNTVADQIDATARTVSEQQGTPTQDGRCEFPAIDVDPSLGDHLVAEVSELNPETCSRTVVTAAYEPSALAELEGDPTAGAGASTRSNGAGGDSWIPGFSCYSGSIQAESPSLFSPPVTGQSYWHRYYKQSFVDPICIAITSTTLNVTWKNEFQSSTGVTITDRTAENYYFTDLGEVWTNVAFNLTPTVEPTSRNNEIYAALSHTRIETDFPENLVTAIALFGSAVPGVGTLGSAALVYAACGFNLGDTLFTSWQQTELRRNGVWGGASGSGSVTGGCSNLVHERVWHGGGTYAR